MQAGALTGARVGELKNMKVKHLDVNNSTISVMGKTGRRDMFLSDKTLEFFISSCNNESEYIFDFRGRN